MLYSLCFVIFYRYIIKSNISIMTDENKNELSPVEDILNQAYKIKVSN